MLSPQALHNNDTPRISTHVMITMQVLRLKAKVLQAKQRVLASPFFANLLAALETTDRRPSLTHDELSYFGEFPSAHYIMPQNAT
jgi:hypothetical protein